MKKNIISNVIIIISILYYSTVFAQTSNTNSQKSYQPRKQIKLSGPRVGVTFISGALADTLKDEFDASPLITQFGWQFKRKFMATENGLAGLTEFIPLIGGIEQGLFLPSLSFVVGLRTANGAEFAIGPNLSLAGVAYVFAGGVTKRYGDLNFPINLSVVASKEGTRVSLLLGFNMAE